MTIKERLHQIIERMPEEDALNLLIMAEKTESRNLPLCKSTTIEEWKRFIESFGRSIDAPAPSEEQFRRENIYEDRGL